LYFYNVINVTIIGTGNLAFHLSKVFLKNQKINLVEICGRKKNLPIEFNHYINYSNNISRIKNSDICFICVSDDQIENISKNLKTEDSTIVLHCSGSTSIDVLSNHNSYGVFYPLQTFSLKKNINFSNIPIIIEGNSNKNLNIIRDLSLMLSNKALKASSKQRLAIHISAVFTNNFTNYMRIVADEILKSNEIDTKILNPLTFETFDKLKYLSSKEAQTGPAIRNDLKTIKKHLNLLKGTGHEKVYETISSQIIKLENEL